MTKSRSSQVVEWAAIGFFLLAVVALPIALIARAQGLPWKDALQISSSALVAYLALVLVLLLVGRIPWVRRSLEAPLFPGLGPPPEQPQLTTERRAAKLIHKPKLTDQGCILVAGSFALFACIWVYSPVVGTGLLVGVVAFRVALTQSRWQNLRGHSIEVTEAGLIQRDPTGTEVARVVFAEPITYEYLDRSPGSAIFQLSQGSRVVRFTTGIPNAARVAGAIGLPWPVRDSAWQDVA